MVPTCGGPVKMCQIPPEPILISSIAQILDKVKNDIQFKEVLTFNSKYSELGASRCYFEDMI